MPLKLHMRKDQKVIINGAVIENVSSHNISLLLMNDAAVLRDTDIMTPDTADTQANRVYFALQCAYVFPDKEVKHLSEFRAFLNDYVQAAPSARNIANDILECVDNRELYNGLRKTRDLIAHERDLLANVQKEPD